MINEKSDAHLVFAWAAQVYHAVIDEVIPGMRTVIRQTDQQRNWCVQFLWDFQAHRGGATVGYSRVFDGEDLKSLKTAEGTYFAESAMEEILRKFPRPITKET
jgi:hypothetical protein